MQSSGVLKWLHGSQGSGTVSSDSAGLTDVGLRAVAEVEGLHPQSEGGDLTRALLSCFRWVVFCIVFCFVAVTHARTRCYLVSNQNRQQLRRRERPLQQPHQEKHTKPTRTHRSNGMDDNGAGHSNSRSRNQQQQQQQQRQRVAGTPECQVIIATGE